MKLPSPFDVGETFKLSDGRLLGFVVTGDITSQKIVVYCHGLSGSRLEAIGDAPAAEAARVRLISIDRPGIGLSTPDPKRSLLSFAEDVDELMDNMGINQFSVVGFSGGAPYALALAHHSQRYSGRVKSVALLSGLGPIDVLGTKGMMVANRGLFTIAAYAPVVVSVFFKIAVGHSRTKLENNRSCASELVRGLVNQPGVRKSDAELLKDMNETEKFEFLVGFLESFRQGSRGVADDSCLMSRKWGFDVDDILLPVHIYHGDDDVNVPLSMADYLHNVLENSKLHVAKDLAHYSSRIFWRDEAFHTL